MKNQTKACVLLLGILATASRILAGPPPQVYEETYKRVQAKIAERQHYLSRSPGSR